MNDMTAFERRIADGMLHRAGPVRPVDDLAVYQAVTARRRSPRWGRTVFSALKLIAAGIIMVLAGAFLLEGVTAPRQTHEILPAAASLSPSPITTERLLSGMDTEEMEPGVVRVINDGFRDLAARPGSWGQDGGVTIGADGAVWVHTASGRFFRIGEEWTGELPQGFRSISSYPQETFGADALHAGPVGQLWAWDARLGRANAWMDADWQERAGPSADAMAVDGTNAVWTAGQEGLLRVDPASETFVDWPRDPDMQVAPHTLDVSADGVPFVLAGPPETDVERGQFDALLQYDGSGWVVSALPAPISAFFPGDGMGVGTDGTVWVAGDVHGDNDVRHHSLARLDGSTWTTFDAADGVEPWGGRLGFVPEEMLKVSTDGSVWVDASTTDGDRWADCDGVARFDGRTWSRYLPGHCVVDLDFAPDGSAWLLATEGDRLAGIQLYVITPHVVAPFE